MFSSFMCLWLFLLIKLMASSLSKCFIYWVLFFCKKQISIFIRWQNGIKWFLDYCNKTLFHGSIFSHLIKESTFVRECPKYITYANPPFQFKNQWKPGTSNSPSFPKKPKHSQYSEGPYSVLQKGLSWFRFFFEVWQSCINDKLLFHVM